MRERKRYRLVAKANPENQPILTAASNTQRYHVRLVLRQFENMRICGHPGDLEFHEPERTNARIWVDLNMKRNIITPRILDPRFRLEEHLVFRIKGQQGAVRSKCTEACFEFTVSIHDCRSASWWVSWGLVGGPM